jgi:hypothetical protein
MTIPKPPTPQQDFLSLLTPDSDIPKSKPRLAVSIEALDKAGKTHWALMTAPDPIALVTNDPGTQVVVEKARAAGRTIHQLVLNYQGPTKLTKAKEDINKSEWDQWVVIWNKYNAFVNAVIRDRSCRTWVTDTETDIWHLAELSYFGKLAGNSSMDLRPKLNYAYTELFWNLYRGRPDLNMILIHRLKKKYVKKEGKNPDAPADWNGEYETDGYGRVAFAVDLTLRAEWDPNVRDFVTYFDPKKAFRYYGPDNAHILNKRWFGQDPNDPSAFWNLGMEVFPNTVDTPEVWGR